MVSVLTIGQVLLLKQRPSLTPKNVCFLFSFGIYFSYLNWYHCSRPRWSRGNVLASRSKVRGFKPGWGRSIFSERKNPEHKSSGRDFKLGVPSLRFQAFKEPQAWKLGLWAKFNRHIHVLVIGYLNLGNIIDLTKVAVHWAVMNTPSV